MIVGYKVEYAWFYYPDDKLAIHKKYAVNHDHAREIMQELLDMHYYNVRIVAIRKRSSHE